ncbi:MAG: hypothetical protein O7E52_04270, partial [Candidatus Poribacteria bacterium]|nr:hypothetical protein [Candidatus Poribacteria bacterium]
KKAMRLNPYYPFNYLFTLGVAFCTTERIEEAAAAHKRALTRNPDFLFSQFCLAACSLALGREDEARAARAEALRISPNFSMKVAKQRFPESPTGQKLPSDHCCSKAEKWLSAELGE